MSNDKKNHPSQPQPSQRPVKINEERGLQPPRSTPPMPGVKPPKK